MERHVRGGGGAGVIPFTDDDLTGLLDALVVLKYKILEHRSGAEHGLRAAGVRGQGTVNAVRGAAGSETAGTQWGSAQIGQPWQAGQPSPGGRGPTRGLG